MNGSIEIGKTSLVTKRYTQKEVIGYEKTLSPVTSVRIMVIKITSVRIMLFIVSYMNLKLHQMDANIVFLNEDLGEHTCIE